MKKIVSLIIFTATLIWTWNIIHSSQAIGFETHSGIQEKLAELIKQTVTNKKPNAKNLRITRLWTETVSDTKVRAVFAYQFSEIGESGENADQTVEGEAILFREPQDETNVDRWTLQSVRTTNSAVTFSEGLVVTPGDDDTITPPAGLAPVSAPPPSENHSEAPSK
jgi:hypothetical protein